MDDLGEILKTIEEPNVDPLPPGAASGWSFSGVPWWLIAIIATILVIAFQIATKEVWRDGFGFIIGGLTITLMVTLGGFVIAIVLGLFIGLARLSKNAILRNLAMYYIELVRGIPVLVTIIVISIVIFGQFFRSMVEFSPAVRATTVVLFEITYLALPVYLYLHSSLAFRPQICHFDRCQCRRWLGHDGVLRGVF